MITRILPPVEWDRLDQFHSKPTIWPFMRPEDIDVLVCEIDGEIVGAMFVMRVTQVEGLEIGGEYRGNAGVFRSLLRLARKVARSKSSEWAFACVGTEEMGDMLTRMGGQRLPVENFVIPVEN